MFDLERDAKEGHLPDFEERKKKRIIEVSVICTKILESYLTSTTHFFLFLGLQEESNCTGQIPTTRKRSTGEGRSLKF